MVNVNYKATDDIIVKLQQLKAELKLYFCRNIDDYHEQKDYMTQKGNF